MKTIAHPQLTENEQQILVWLLHHPLQRIPDVAVGLDLTISTTARSLQKLGTHHFVDKVSPSINNGNRHGWYYLTTSGLNLVAELEGNDPVVLARMWGADERHLLRLLPRFSQIATLQQGIGSLVVSSPAGLASPSGQPEIRWGWQRGYTATFQKRRQVMRCEADAAVVLRRNTPQDQFFALLIYLDLGKRYAFTSHSTMIRKLRHLLLYRESQERQPYRSMFPLVMILVESTHELDLWQQAAQEATRQLHLGKPLAAVIANLAIETKADRVVSQKGGSRSMWNYAWRHLMTNAPCRLQEMLVPMTAAALPPDIVTSRLSKQEGSTQKPRLSSMLVRGDYHERLDDLLKRSMAGSVLSSTQERELIALLGLHMSERYREILLLLYANPLLSTDEIAVLGGLHARTTERYLLTLEQWGCLLPLSQRQPAKSKPEKRWVLSVRGLRYLAASMNAHRTTVLKSQSRVGRARPTKPQADVPQSADALAKLRQPGVLQLYRDWSHTRGVYHCLVAFLREACAQPTHSITWFETHFRCARRYRASGVWHNFRPDAVVEYVVRQESGRQRFHLWLEWDSGTMGNKALRAKIETYRLYSRSLEWRRQMNTGAVALLLIIVPNRSQQNRMIRLVQEVISRATLHVRITSREFLQEQGPLAKIWTAVLPSEHPSRLRELLDMEVAGSMSF